MAKKKVSYDLFGRLQLARIEREVEDAWNGGISLFFADSPIEHPFSCDGFISDGLLLRLIIEYKFDEKLSNAVARARVLVQVLFYLKRFEGEGLPLPNVIMAADKNECFVIHANDILGYLDEDVSWSVAPSSAADENPSLVAKIANNDTINPFIFTVGPGFDLVQVVNRVKDLAMNIKRYVRVTEHNIAQIFDYYSNSVLRDPAKLEPHQLVESFIGVILEPDDYYLHPRKKNILVTKFGEVPIFKDAFVSFFDFYNQTYTPQEKMKFTEIMDRLIEDVTRRRNGEFFTPTPFVDYAHRLLEKELGDDWKDRYVVWDCCAGTKNLTRDYRFKELYCSTLNETDLNIADRYNREAKSFVFDFLNDSLDSLPKSLLKVLNDKRPLVFFLNPPYAGSGSGLGTSKESGSVKTKVNAEMLEKGIGTASQNLYAQFMFRIGEIVDRYGLNDCRIGLFSPTLFLTGSGWKHFRTYFLDKFSFDYGIQFKASYFSDVDDSWGISFSVWNHSTSNERHIFMYSLVDNRDGRIIPYEKKVLYNLDGVESASSWVRSKEKEIPSKLYPCAKSALNFSDMLKEKASRYGFLINDTNNVDANTMGVYFINCPVSRHLTSVAVNEDNILRCTALFAARKLVEKNWVNSKDEYCVPDTSFTGYQEFEYDSLVFSLFHNSSNQSSLRNIKCRGLVFDVRNEFFWMSRDQILQLANETGNMDCYSDAKTDKERYVYTRLCQAELSKEAKDVLRKADLIVKETFPYRRVFDDEHPEYQINNWDCGWYQIKALAAQYAKKDLEDFRELYIVLSKKMLPKVYDFGFLLK